MRSCYFGSTSYSLWCIIYQMKVLSLTASKPKSSFFPFTIPNGHLLHQKLSMKKLTGKDEFQKKKLWILNKQENVCQSLTHVTENPARNDKSCAEAYKVLEGNTATHVHEFRVINHIWKQQMVIRKLFPRGSWNKPIQSYLLNATNLQY